MRTPPRLPGFLSKRWVSFAAQGVLFASLLVGTSLYQTRKHLRAQLAPGFDLHDLSGNRVSLADFRHKKVLLHFFATWCGVCRLEFPSLERLSRNLGPDEVLLAVVEDSDDVEEVRRFVREHELSYPILLGSPEILRAYRVDVFPTNYFLNGDGTLSSSSVGLSTLVGMRLRLWLARGSRAILAPQAVATLAAPVAKKTAPGSPSLSFPFEAGFGVTRAISGVNFRVR